MDALYVKKYVIRANDADSFILFFVQTRIAPGATKAMVKLVTYEVAWTPETASCNERKDVVNQTERSLSEQARRASV